MRVRKNPKGVNLKAMAKIAELPLNAAEQENDMQKQEQQVAPYLSRNNT